MSTGDAGVATTEDEDDDLPRPGKVWDNSGPSLSELLKQQRSAPTPPPAPEPVAAAPAAPESSNVEAVDPMDLPGVWKSLLDLLAEKGPGLPGLLHHGRFIGVEDGKAVIRYAKQHETFVKMFDRNGKKDQVREAFSKVLQQNVGVAFDVEAEESAAPAGVATMPAPVASPAKTPAKAGSPAIAPVRREIPAPPPAPAATRPTQEQIDALRSSDPLIKALMDDMGATIMKIEDQ
jgi:hypothetical protein